MKREIRIPIHASSAVLLGLLLLAVAPPADLPRPGVRTASLLCDPAALALQAHLDATGLRRGGSGGGTARLHLVVEGTAAPVRVELTNRTPGVVALEGGDVQRVRTPGGVDNHLERTLVIHRAGEFQIEYRLASRPCPTG